MLLGNLESATIIPMSAQEARECADAIKGNLESLRFMLLNLERRRGWEALGYSSWRECAQKEFRQSQGYVYKLLHAAEVEENLAASEIIQLDKTVPIPINQLEELHKLPAEQQAAGLQRADEIATVEGKQRTAIHVAQAVKEINGLTDTLDKDDEDLARFEVIATSETEPMAKMSTASSAIVTRTTPNLLPFHCLMSVDQREILYKAINQSKQREGLETTAQALCTIAEAYCKMKAFNTYRMVTGLLSDLSVDEFPTLLWGWNDETLYLPATGTHFGYVHRGELAILNTSDRGFFLLKPGMYFSLPGDGTLIGDGQGIAITRLDYQGVFSIGGPIEPNGRLRYIDGCTDSLLIPPVMQGDPCLNALYFPPGINQTQHTHPSMRIGIVVSGCGECITSDEVIPLEPGQAFIIPTGGLHSFRTTDSPMVVCAYHPDSDYGPTHEAHPMILRTMVNGISASQLEEIRTLG